MLCPLDFPVFADGSLFEFGNVFQLFGIFHVSLLMGSFVTAATRVCGGHFVLQGFGEVVQIDGKIRHVVLPGEVLWEGRFLPDNLLLTRLYPRQTSKFIPPPRQSIYRFATNAHKVLIGFAGDFHRSGANIAVKLESISFLVDPTTFGKVDLRILSGAQVTHGHCIAYVYIHRADYEVVNGKSRRL